MLILHAVWIENSFYLWAESTIAPDGKAADKGTHPFSSSARELRRELEQAELLEKATKTTSEIGRIWLPSFTSTPLPSSPILGEVTGKAKVTLRPWKVDFLRLRLESAQAILTQVQPANLLRPGLVGGEDLRFWSRALRFAGGQMARQSYVPDLVQSGSTYHARWRPVLNATETAEFNKLVGAMPASARAAAIGLRGEIRTAEVVLEEFLSVIVDALVRRSLSPKTPVPSTPHDAWVAALHAEKDKVTATPAELDALIQEVRRWQRPLEIENAAPWRLCFRLEEPLLIPDQPIEGIDETWEVRYLLQARDEPSLQIPLPDALNPKSSGHALLRRAGSKTTEYLLAALGQAGALYPPIAKSLHGQIPGGFELNTEEAFQFLTEAASNLENAGFGVFLPSWWSGRGTKTRLAARGTVRGPKFQSKSKLGLDEVLKFEWQLALGNESITQAELEQLASLQSSLVRFRGQWVQVNKEQLQQALKFWQRKGNQTATARELLLLALHSPAAGDLLDEAPDDLEVETVNSDGWFSDLLQRLKEPATLQPLPTSEDFQGQLRPYQQTGYSWMEFLSRWGLGACLADDMGLGKTVQVLAFIQRQWAAARQEQNSRPVLLICPTSVVTNWYKEAQKFTPDLPVMVHHGGTRRKGEFAEEAASQAIVLSSYALLHRDLEKFKEVSWAGLVLDEAQNIKNSNTLQAKAARAIPADFRIAMTGTPVENNVGDLWSLMEFLNPGLLGTQTEFRRRFFAPIQSGSRPEAVQDLHKLVGPFILRRVKTDKTVISDLPDKVETKVYCNLTREQGSLYANIVDEELKQIEDSEGIQRRGIVLSMLMRLKQICNHPAHFLKDGTALPGRSGKLTRLEELIEEMLSEGDTGLIFTQFHEMGEMLKSHLQETFGEEVLFLHGATSKKARDTMVTRFQSEDGPRLFILSLKAGGVGLNLTRANHVFHFDRWWNPAVENQATDRAFRIGQQKNVQVHKFVCTGTLEERIDEMIEAKQSLAANVLGTGENWLTELSTTELRDILTLQKDAVRD